MKTRIAKKIIRKDVIVRIWLRHINEWNNLIKNNNTNKIYTGNTLFLITLDEEEIDKTVYISHDMLKFDKNELHSYCKTKYNITNKLFNRIFKFNKFLGNVNRK